MKREDCPRKRKSWQCSEESAWVLLWHRAQDHADFGEAHEGNDKMSERKAGNAWVRPAELMGRAVPPVTQIFPQLHTVLRIQRWKKYPVSVVEQKIPRQRIWTCSVLLEGLCGLKLSLGNRHILGCDGPGLTRSCKSGGEHLAVLWPNSERALLKEEKACGSPYDPIPGSRNWDLGYCKTWTTSEKQIPSMEKTILG